MFSRIGLAISLVASDTGGAKHFRECRKRLDSR